MGALTPTVVRKTAMGGSRIEIFTVTPAATSDTVTFTVADYGIRTIYGVIAVLEGGADADLTAGIQASFSSLVVTLVMKNAAGAAATDWTSATIRLIVICD